MGTRLARAGQEAKPSSVAVVGPPVPAAVSDAIRRPGAPLDPWARLRAAHMYGEDLAVGTRIHTDAGASDSAESVGAAAYTVGRHIVFGTGRYSPNSEPGRRLIDHELAHVAQQGIRDHCPTEPLRLLPPDSPLERRAEQAAAGHRNQDRSALCVARQAAPGPSPTPAAPAPLPSADVLTDRIATAIGVWETNRGGTQPNPRESGLQTVAGLPASMATIEQATMPYVIDALTAHPELQRAANPPLTPAEVAAARNRVTAVTTLLAAVEDAGTQTPDQFISARHADIVAAGLTDDNVRTMFAARTLHTTVTTAHAAVAQAPPNAQQATAGQQAAAIPQDQRLGINQASLTTYIRSPATWGENRAAWQRRAVETMPNQVGARIESVATAQHGTQLAATVIRTRVNAQLAAPAAQRPTLESLVSTVAAQNNSGEANYGTNVWQTYQRLFPAPVPAATPAHNVSPVPAAH